MDVKTTSNFYSRIHVCSAPFAGKWYSGSDSGRLLSVLKGTIICSIQLRPHSRTGSLAQRLAVFRYTVFRSVLMREITEYEPISYPSIICGSQVHANSRGLARPLRRPHGDTSEQSKDVIFLNNRIRVPRQFNIVTPKDKLGSLEIVPIKSTEQVPEPPPGALLGRRRASHVGVWGRTAPTKCPRFISPTHTR